MASGWREKHPAQSGADALPVVLGAERPIIPSADAGEVEPDVLDVVGWPDRRVADVAARQRALIARRQLLALGIESSMIARALRRGRLHRVHQGVYSLVPFAALPPLAAELAAVLACGDAALLAGHAAAATWGLRPAFDGDVDVIVVGSDRGRNRAGIRVHSVNELDPRDIRRYQGIPITSPAPKSTAASATTPPTSCGARRR
jgi:Transcriptional regulator, AbiEi antitoxin